MRTARQIRRRRDTFGSNNVDELGNIIYPLDSTNNQRYEEYLRVGYKMSKIWLNRHEMLKTGEKIDITARLTPQTHRIRGIEKFVRDDILKRSGEWHKLKGRYTHLLKEAYYVRNQRTNNEQELIRRRLELVEYFSRYFSVSEVHRICKESWGMRGLPLESIQSFIKQNSEEIRIGQDNYKNSVDEIRLVYKRSRLDEMLDLYNGRRIIYDQYQKHGDYVLLMNTLEQIRKEVEGERVTVDAAFNVQLETAAVDHQEDIMRKLPIKMMILGMVSGRLGIDPKYLVTKLANSYYAKYTGFGGRVSVYDHDDITFPSEMIYNMDEMKELAKAREEGDAELMTPYELVEADGIESQKGSMLKEMLAKKEKMIKRKQEVAVEVVAKGTRRYATKETEKAVKDAKMMDKANKNTRNKRKKSKE